ncbi:hypothetical protein [Herbaspirillum sp. CAH-3]|uniref:hypothetical protein n=1 Tax=Herbaspirillum sp. CAH-3 TaxID=2605746 RepID=UPI0012ACEFF0|nr:hypothetical protein [Herbaspirillum sp. CAH-3]MRT30815.1 hypothetical protein [Herbaspirillum sp. CAH-3]
MTTVFRIIELALRDINTVGEDEQLSPSIISDALDTLNQMIAQWTTEKQYVYAQKVVMFSANGSGSYTIGPGGTIDIALPAKIDAASWRDGLVDFPLQVVDSLEEWERIGVKTLSGVPLGVFFQRLYPVGNLLVWPQAQSGQIRLVTRVGLDGYTSLTNDMMIPPEYQLAVRYSLAELMSMSLGVPISPDILRQAANARRVMKRQNTTVLKLDMPPGVPYRRIYKIYSDQ